MEESNTVEMIISKIEEKGVRKGKYFRVMCPQCNRRDAFIYEDDINRGLYLARVRCNHKNSCGYNAPLFEFLDVKESDIIVDVKEEIIEAFNTHNIPYKLLIASGVIGEDFSFKLGMWPEGKKVGKIAYERLRLIGGKLRWAMERGWKKEYRGAFLSPILLDSIISAGESSQLFVFEGEWDFLKALCDGICCTMSPFGANVIPTDIDVSRFFGFREIYIVYDNDDAGERGAKKLASWLFSQFDSIVIKRIRFPEGIKDYCEYRKAHTADRFFELVEEAEEIEPRQKEVELYRKLKQSRNITFLETEEITGRYNWAVTDKGIYKIVDVSSKVKCEDSKIYELVTPDIIKVEGRLVDIWNKESYIKVSLNGESLVFKSSILYSGELKRLTEAGARIGSENQRAMTQYLLDCVDSLSVENRYSSRLGWYKDEFILGNVSIGINGSDIIETNKMLEFVRPAGDEEKWKSCVSSFLESEPENQAIFYASFASFFLELLQSSPFTVHVYGLSSSGKTLASKVAASLWGDFSRLLNSWRGTTTGHECLFHFYNSVPTFLEEAQEQNRSWVQETIYMYGNGYGKARAEIQDGMIVFANVRRWRGVLVSTGESRIADVTEQEGTRARVIEIEKNRIIERSECEILNIESTLLENHGHIISFISHVFKDFERFKQELQKRYSAKLRFLEEFEVERLSIRRKYRFYAAIMTAGSFASEFWGFPYNEEDVVEKLFEEEVLEDPPGERLYNAIVDMVNSNRGRFAVANNKSFNSDLGSIECWGGIEDNVNIVYIFPNILKKKLLEMGWSVSQLKLIKNKMLLENRKKAGLRIRACVNGVRKYVYAIKML